MSAAVLSPCARYRYALTREWACGTGTVLFVMLNPSTADATTDDPTTRRCAAFARGWGYRRLTIANLFAYRAPDPSRLLAVTDPVGPDNDLWLARLSAEATAVVAAWGAHARAPRVEQVRARLARPLSCLGHTLAGAPRHPLYLPRDTARVAL